MFLNFSREVQFSFEKGSLSRSCGRRKAVFGRDSDAEESAGGVLSRRLLLLRSAIGHGGRAGALVTGQGALSRPTGISGMDHTSLRRDGEPQDGWNSLPPLP